MGIRTRRRLRDGLVGLFVLTCAGMAQPVLATAAPPATPAAGTPDASSATPSTHTSYSTRATSFSVTVSPARLTVGQDALNRTQQITLVNRGKESVALTVQKRNFIAQPDGGLNYQPDAPWGAADWVHVSPTRLSLEPGESEIVNATFDVPEKPEPGDHQVALVFLAPSVRSAGNIQVSRGIGAPVYLTVPGVTDDSVRLDGLTGPGWSFRGNPTLTARLTSTGTVHRDFRGPTALAVGTPGHTGAFPDFTVTRGAQRVVDTGWRAPLLCVCHPSVTVTNPGQAPQTISTRVVVVPWWMLAGLLLVIVVGAVVLLARHHRREILTQGGRALAGADPVTHESG